MAGQRENDEVERDIAEAVRAVEKLRPTHWIALLWGDLEACLSNIRKVEFYLGYLPEKPRDHRTDHEAIQTQLMDARAVLGMIALTLAERAGDDHA